MRHLILKQLGLTGLFATALLLNLPAIAEDEENIPKVAPVRPLTDQPAQTPTMTDQQAMDASNRRMQESSARRQAQMRADSMDPSTRQAWDRYQANNYGTSDAAKLKKKRDFLQLQRDWDQVQAEAHKGNITPDDNSRFLRDHAADMRERMEIAGGDHGLDVKLQDPSGPQKTYSDVDGHGYPEGASKDGYKPGQAGDMDVEQFTQAREDFNRSFNDDLKAAGLEPVANPAERMRSDLMPITEDPALFQAVEGKINPDGGVMYQDPNAVRQEVANRRERPGGGVEGDVTSANTKADYLQEQVRQQRAHSAEATHLIDEGNRLISDPVSTPEDVRRGRRLLEQAQGEGSSLIGKYEERANRVINQAADQAGTQGIEISETRQGAIDDVGKTRDVSVTQQSADIAATSENAIVNQQVEGSRVMASDGELSAAAEIGRNADPSTRGRIVEEARNASFDRNQQRLQDAHPDWSQADIDAAARSAANDDAARIAQEMRTGKPDVPDPSNNRWDINENPNRGMADADAAASAATQDARDLAAVDEARSAREAAGVGDGAAPDAPGTAPDGSTTGDLAGTTDGAAGAVDGTASGADLTTTDGSVTGSAADGGMTASADAPAGTSAADDLARTAGAADNAASAGARTGQIVDAAGRMVDAAALGGQIADAATRQAGQAIDENRDLTAADAGSALIEATGATGMYDLGNRISTEENLRRERGEQGVLMTGARTGARMAGEVADALVNEPVARAIAEEEAAAEREGREPSYVSSTASATAEIGGNLTGIRQIGDAIYETTTWDERADAAAQADALDQHLGSQAILTDRRIGNLQRELERLGTQGDLSDPATMEAIRQRQQELRDANDHMGRIQAVANRNSGSLSADTVNQINAQASSQANPEDIDDYVQQMVNDRQQAAANQADSGDDLADAFVSAGDEGGSDWNPGFDRAADDFGDEFADAVATNQEGRAGRTTFSDGPELVADTSIDDVWDAERTRTETADSRLRDSAAAAQSAHEQAWSSTLAGVDSDLTNQDQQGQQTLQGAQQQGQAALDAASKRPDPRLSATDFGDRQRTLQDEQDRLQRERDQILTGGGGGAAGPLDPNKGGQYGGAAIAAAAAGNEAGFDRRQANCNDVVKSGGNNPASVSISGAGFGGSATLNWDHYGVKDRIAVISGGSVLFDSGCVPNKGSTPISVGGQVKVIVEPNCAQTSNSAWQFTVACSSGLAQQ